MEALQGRLRALAVEMEAFSKLLAALAAMKFNLSAAERQTLQSYLCPDLTEGEQGWEETVLASLTHLLRTALNPKGKDSGAATASNTLEVNSLSMHPMFLSHVNPCVCA